MFVFYWLIAAIICVVLEIITQGLTAIWYAVGALAAALVAHLGFSLGVQIAVFLVVSLICFLPTRKLADRMVNNRVVKTNVDSLIGQTCMVTKDIDNLKNEGQAVVKGMEWSARSAKEDGKIPAGTKVIIRKISGVKLIVTPAE